MEKRLIFLVSATYLSLLCVGCDSHSPPTGKPNAVQASAIARSGYPIVDAIYHFRNDWGIWPASFDDIVPAYLSQERVNGWRYEWHPSYWHLRNYSCFPEAIVMYAMRGKEVGWGIMDGEGFVSIETDYQVPKLVQVSSSKFLEKTRVQFDARIGRDPGKLVHRKGFVSLCIAEKQYGIAREVLQDALRRWPKNWWCQYGLACVERLSGDQTGEPIRLIEYCQAYDDFAHDYLLAAFFLEIRESQRAYAIIRGAIGKKGGSDLGYYDNTGEARVIPVHGLVWRAVQRAYEDSQFELVIDLCDWWGEHLKKSHDLPDPRLSFFRSAAYLALGKVALAGEVATSVKVEIDDSPRAEHYLSEYQKLRAAIDCENTRFRYISPRFPDALSLIIDYH